MTSAPSFAEYRLPGTPETKDATHLDPHNPVADHINVSYPEDDGG